LLLRGIDTGKLLLVYNAYNGAFNALADTLHKVFSPATYQCSLCQYTCGLTGMVLPWKKFLDSLGLESRFLYRDGFREEFPAANPSRGSGINAVRSGS
jgi:hypothetical protein